MVARMTVQLFDGGRDEAIDYLDTMVELYETVFAEPPYREGPEAADRFRGWVTEECDHPGFRLIGALDAGTLVGMAYGYTMPAGEWWRDTIDAPADQLLRAPKFAIMEWAVHPGHRGRNLGRRLMDELLGGRTETYGTLAANPAAAAHEMYLRWGWQIAGYTVPGHSPSMTVMIKPLAAAEHQEETAHPQARQ